MRTETQYDLVLTSTNTTQPGYSNSPGRASLQMFVYTLDGNGNPSLLYYISTPTYQYQGNQQIQLQKFYITQNILGMTTSVYAQLNIVPGAAAAFPASYIELEFPQLLLGSTWAGDGSAINCGLSTNTLKQPAGRYQAPNCIATLTTGQFQTGYLVVRIQNFDVLAPNTVISVAIDDADIQLALSPVQFVMTASLNTIGASATPPYMANSTARRLFSQTFTQLTIMELEPNPPELPGAIIQGAPITISGTTQSGSTPAGGYTFAQPFPVATT